MDQKSELLKFGNAWNEAMVANDVDAISKFMSDDWIIVGTDGGITTKSEFLMWIRSGDLTHSRMDADETRIDLYGTTGVVTSRGTSAGKYKDEPFELYEWSTSVFIHRAGTWTCVHTMLTPALRAHTNHGG